MSLISAKTRILLNLFLPQRRRPNPRYSVSDADTDLSGKTIVFTGGTDGIGRVAVEILFKMGADIVLLGRNRAKSEEVIRQLKSMDDQRTARLYCCDLASMESVNECADRILADTPHIDVLINNAGINLNRRIITPDGFETNWAVNYLGPYLLTNRLLKRVRESAPSRIVNLTTNTEFLDELDCDEISVKTDFDTNSSYVESKLSMNMFSIDLALELEGSGATVNSLCPGYIRSNLLSNLSGPEKIMQAIMNIMASPAEVGADRLVRLAISSEFSGVNGIYLNEDQTRPHHRDAQNFDKRKRIRKITEKALSQWLPIQEIE
ncbi:SDR family oxidoreductase [Arenicella sp. 4NH20-0111]|uniref:SDR family NAD(P)-dependent oxidoreductase n=1 Tax=Arenicella sp. 4NH20-0111 TaxID=3127648 RepID=UPI00310BA3A5